MPATFADLGVPTDLVARLAKRGITEPFPIQTATVPDALAGRDICGRAPTGSGKTLAFGLAIAARVQRGVPLRPRALVLVPTRELAAQVATEIEGLTSDKRGVVAIYGGASYGPQRRALSKGVATVVACPGRLEDLLAQGDVILDQVEIVVLDEADRMADMGFLPSVRRLLDQTNPKRQTLLFSATLDGDIDAIVRSYQRSPARHEVAGDEDSVGDVEHIFWRAEPSQRAGLTADLVEQHGRAVVFCRTRHGADRVAKQLTQVGISAKAIHGSRTQSQREKALAAFASGRVDALVATDVAARGIHVDGVACVVHFDVPGDSKDYVHRSGRTGRAGASGLVVSLVSDQQRKAVRGMQRALGLPEGLDAPPVVTGRVRVKVPVETPAPSHKPKSKQKRPARNNGSGGFDRSDRPRSGTGPRSDRPNPGPGKPRRKPKPGAGTSTGTKSNRFTRTSSNSGSKPQRRA